MVSSFTVGPAQATWHLREVPRVVTSSHPILVHSAPSSVCLNSYDPCAASIWMHLHEPLVAAIPGLGWWCTAESAAKSYRSPTHHSP